MKQVFSIDTEIYNQEKIENGIADFSEVGDISFDGNSLEITGNEEYSPEEIFHEFMNYILSL